MSTPKSLLPLSFNVGWIEACNRYEAGQLDGFAMIHGDVVPSFGWLDDLHEELVRSDVDVISAVIPIKDDRGLSSTALETGEQWDPRRLTMREIHQLPETFRSSDTEVVFGMKLLINTGLLLCKLGPWSSKVLFRLITGGGRFGPENRLRSGDIGEDWTFSRDCHKLGVKLAATRKIPLLHYGSFGWNNQHVWGWVTDQPDSPSGHDL